MPPSRDLRLLFATRSVRMFAYGMLSVVLVLYLVEAGWSGWQVGWLISLALAGDIAVSLAITTAADAIGRRRMLLASALVMLVSGAVFALSDNFWVLLAAATLGIISPSDKEVGPFLSLEQAALAQIVPDARRVGVFAWYNLAGSFAAALGSLCGGQIVQLGQSQSATGVRAFQPVILGYAVAGGALASLFACMTPAVEVRRREADAGSHASPRPLMGLHQSRGVILMLAALFSLDAFAGGFIIQSVTAFWFHQKFQVEPAALGAIFLVANLLAGVSALAAGWLAGRIGLVNTMVFTHLPSNVLLLLVPLVPDAGWAIGLFLLRFSVSQMDVPTRQALTMQVVAPDERSAAAGVTAVARSVGSAISPLLAAWMLATPALWSLPMLLAGTLKIAYDLLLYRTMGTRRV